jgi:signal peptidase II
MIKVTYPFFAISALVLLLDLFSKHLIQLSFAYGDSLTINAYFDLVRYHNEGAAFSFLAQAGGWQKAFFTGVALLAIVVMSYLIQKHRTEKLFCLSLALVIGGAAGNVYDRLTLGYVVDFISLHYQDLYWPAFNVADSAICLGVGLLVLDSFKSAAPTPQ